MTNRSLLLKRTALFGLAWAWIAAITNAATVLIDFGAAATTTDALSRIWNNVSASTDLTGSPFTLLGSAGTDSGYRLTISNPPGVTNAIGFNGNNANGTTSPTGAALAHNYPSTATQDSAYGNTVTFGGGIVESVRLTLSNLDPNERYNFDFFASRISAGGDNREAEYFITEAVEALRRVQSF